MNNLFIIYMNPNRIHNVVNMGERPDNEQEVSCYTTLFPFYERNAEVGVYAPTREIAMDMAKKAMEPIYEAINAKCGINRKSYKNIKNKWDRKKVHLLTDGVLA